MIERSAATQVYLCISFFQFLEYDRKHDRKDDRRDRRDDRHRDRRDDRKDDRRDRDRDDRRDDRRDRDRDDRKYDRKDDRRDDRRDDYKSDRGSSNLFKQDSNYQFTGFTSLVPDSKEKLVGIEKNFYKVNNTSPMLTL